MVYYEVSLTVDSEVTEAYATWLAEHVRQILALPGFEAAEWLEDAEPDEAGRARWVVRYRLESAEALDRYTAEFAETMRGDGLARFAGRFTATRRVLRPVETFAAEA